jgi:hypothetical protein
MSASGSGSLEMLEWCVAHELPLASLCTWQAAIGGHLEALQWLRRHGCQWHHQVIDAAWYGHLDVLQWALANEFPWTSEQRLNCLVLARLRPGIQRWIEECWPDDK